MNPEAAPKILKLVKKAYLRLKNWPFNKPREWLVMVGFGWFWLVFDQYDQ